MCPQHALHIKYNEFNAIKSYVQDFYVPHNSQLSLCKRFENTHTNKLEDEKKKNEKDVVHAAFGFWKKRTNPLEL